MADIGTLMDRTDRLVMAVTLAKGVPARFAVVALGNYPAGIVGMRLSGNKDWTKKTVSTGTYWEWTGRASSSASPTTAFFSPPTAGVETLLGRWTAPVSLSGPAGRRLRHGAAATWCSTCPELPGGLSEKAAANDVHIPLQEVWITAGRRARRVHAGGHGEHLL